MEVINYKFEEGRRDNQREGVSLLGEEKGGKEEGESSSYTLPIFLLKPFSKGKLKQGKWLCFSCISDAIGVFILEYVLLYAMWEVLNKNPLLQA